MRLLVTPVIVMLAVMTLSGCSGATKEEVQAQEETVAMATEEQIYEPVFDESEIATYREDFLVAQEAGDYVGMNKAMHKIEDAKRAFYGEDYTSERFDYTHGGIVSEYDYLAYGGNIAGTVYIFSLPAGDTNKSKEELADRQSLGEKDYAVIDYRYLSDPDMQVRNSYRATDAAERKGVIQALLDHEQADETAWDRTFMSMENEWNMHNLSYIAGYQPDRAMHVDFNNKDEGSYSF